ncbi:MAG: HD domain-containing protein [Candidatus Bathyarchaeota archaeon]|nr:HD domain-containing protein [Candidatus Termiticorpusculum sp.]
MKVDIKSVIDKTKGEKVEGSVYVSSFVYKTSKNGELFVRGCVRDQKLVIGFTVWSENVEAFREAFAASKILTVLGVVDVWQDMPSIVFKSVKADVYGYKATDFLFGYNKKQLDSDFYEFLEHVNPRVRQLVDKLVEGELKERFFTEFAANKMHDACPGGLAGHTIKMLRLAKTVVDNDKRLLPYSELIYVGVICHDIGKIREYYMGDYAKNGFVSHIDYGCEMLYSIKDFVVDLFDEVFFYHLISIIRGHHHIYGDRAKTVYAYIIHLIDMIDSQTTMFLDNLDTHNYKETSNGEKITIHNNEVFYY